MTSSGTPPAFAAKYNGGTLNIVSALYSDDNTNSFVINNVAGGVITATGHFAAAYYGRADTTLTNAGTFGNTNWVATDTISAGHWAIGTYAGADFATVTGSNPDTPLYDVKSITTNAQGNKQGTLAVTDTSATTVTNTGVITGDILVLDTNPLVTAAAAASGKALPLAVSGSNSGPRDSTIANSGTINGSFYLGSGDHEIDNAAAGTINGSIAVDQRASIGTFATGVAGTVAGAYSSAGLGTTSSTGSACPAAGANTTDPYCATTSNVLASFHGAQTLNLTNEGTLTGNITITDQATSVNNITLTGTGFSGNVIAINGTGSNSLTLAGVTNLKSVQNFSSLDLMQSNVAVTGGVSLVSGASLATTIYGAGGAAASPSTNVGTIQGTLTLAGTTTVAPTITSPVHDGDVFELASAVAGTGATTAGDITVSGATALVSFTADTSSGALLLDTTVANAAKITGISTTAGQTINGLISYNGGNAGVQALAVTVESLATTAQVKAAGTALSPIVNGADVQAPIDGTELFSQQIDSRLDQFIYAQIPSSGRSADLGVSRPVPVYGALPANGAWIEGLGGGFNQSNVNGVAGYTAEFEGVIGGYDRLIAPGLRVGAAMGYIDTRVNGEANLTTREDIQTYQGLACAEFAQDHYYLRGSVGYGGVNYDSSRQINVAGVTDTATGTHKGNILTVRGEAGLPYEVAGNLLVPYAAFTYGHLTQGAYTETSAGGAALGYAAATNDSERSEIGGKVIIPVTTMPLFSAFFPLATSSVALEGRAAYVHDFGNVGQTVTAAFAGGNAFVISGPVPDRDMIDFGAGLKMATGPVQIDLSYNGLARSTFYEQYGLLRVRYMF